MTQPSHLPNIPLPAGIRSRFADGINGLRMHVLEAGFETSGRPLLLLHGFPELAYSWRKVMGAGGGRLSRDRAGPARLWPYHRLGCRL
jgi:pimeloyl-ACP methyl ester carboxylesterase